MLYLLLHRSTDKYYYKVGFAKNNERRFGQYQTYNPTIKFLLEREGNLYEEFLLHRYLHLFKNLWKFHKDEWYVCDNECPEILEHFMTPFQEVKEKLWASKEFLIKNPSAYEEDFLKEWLTINGIGNLTQEEVLRLPGDLLKSTILTGPNEILNGLNQYFLDHKDFIDRMKEYCNVMVNSSEVMQKEILRSVVIPKKYHEYYSKVGPERLRAQSYEESKILIEINNTNSVGDIKSKVLEVFNGTQRIPKSEAKSTLQKIYDDLGLKKKAKASDLGEFYNIAPTVLDINGKKVNFFKLISIK